MRNLSVCYMKEKNEGEERGQKLSGSEGNSQYF